MNLRQHIIALSSAKLEGVWRGERNSHWQLTMKTMALQMSEPLNKLRCKLQHKYNTCCCCTCCCCCLPSRNFKAPQTSLICQTQLQLNDVMLCESHNFTLRIQNEAVKYSRKARCTTEAPPLHKTSSCLMSRKGVRGTSKGFRWSSSSWMRHVCRFSSVDTNIKHFCEICSVVSRCQDNWKA